MRKIRLRLLSLAISMFLLFCIFLYSAFDKLDVPHYDPESSDARYNIYVNHDGFNYVINSNYFTGYCVLAGTCLIGSSIFFTAFTVLAIDNERILFEKHTQNQKLE